MDRHTLVTIALTALITVTVTETAKWLFAWAKIAAVSDITKQKAKIIFSRSNRVIVWNSFWLIVTVFVFLERMVRKTPITRDDVLTIPLSFMASLFWLGALIWSLLNKFRKY
jgi:hypothetical protein